MVNFALSPGTEVSSSQRTYTIQRVLGQGGFGITYLVETQCQMGNISFTGRFALKEHFIQMLCERDASTNRVRFLQSASKEVETSKRAFISEAQRLQKLGISHHNIVNIDEVFEANGTAYYVMEYLDGGSLANYVKTHGGKLSWTETSILMRPICEAVAMLHSKNVAHYDIKPQNIMVMTETQGLRPVLIDFGLAKHYNGQGEATSSIAAAGYTPGYAPMEQYTGIQEFSPTADVYSLAATICFCLTGHAPAKADKLNLDILCDELLTLGVDASIANILLRAMELRTTDRPANAGALAAALFSNTSQQAMADQQLVTKKREPVRPKAKNTDNSDKRNNVDTRPYFTWFIIMLTILSIVVVCIIINPNKGSSTANSPSTSHNEVRFRTAPQNLDLQVIHNGEKYYFSQSEWSNLSSDVQSHFIKSGLVIDYNGDCFVVKLNKECHGDGDYYYKDEPTSFTWDEAKQWVNNMSDNWRLPTKDEGIAMARQHDAVCFAISTFGGDQDYVDWVYWTSAEYNATQAWYFDLEGCIEDVYIVGKGINYEVRAVRDL